MRFRKLRIAWSVLFSILCVLVIVLWVRSYGECPAYFPFGFRVYPTNGKIVLGDSWKSIHDPNFDHQMTCYPVYLPPNNEFGLPAGWSSVMGYTDTGFKLPLWYAIFWVGSLGGAPWFRWRFSLRTLLSLTTIVALLIWLLTWINC